MAPAIGTLIAALPALPQAEVGSAREELAIIARRIHYVYLSILPAVTGALFFVRTDFSYTSRTALARCSFLPWWR